MTRVKSTKIMPAKVLAEFLNSPDQVLILDRELNPLSYRLAVNRYNKGTEVLKGGRTKVYLVRRTDEQTNEYLFVKQ